MEGIESSCQMKFFDWCTNNCDKKSYWHLKGICDDLVLCQVEKALLLFCLWDQGWTQTDRAQEEEMWEHVGRFFRVCSVDFLQPI